MPLRPDRFSASSDPDDRPEPSLSRSRAGRAGEASARAAIMAGPGRDAAASGLELRAGERMSVVSSDSDERASDRGLFVKAAGGAIILLAIVGVITLLHGFAGL